MKKRKSARNQAVRVRTGARAAASRLTFGAPALPAQIAALRQKQGWSQADLGRRIGMAQPGIARLENLKYRRYSLTTLERIAKALKAKLVVRIEEK